MAGIVYKKIDRPPKELIKAFRNIHTSIISDCLNRSYAMKAEIQPIFDGVRVCGPAITVQCMCGNNIASHIALTLCQKGDVIVIDGRGHPDTSIWGGIQTIYAKKIGVQGAVIDGAIRDAAEIRKRKFPVFCKGIVPTGPHKGWGDSVNVPIQCGGVPVNPGDLIVGDDDGIVVVPKMRLKEILNASRKRLALEKQWEKRMASGQNTLEAVGLVKHLESLDIEYR